MVRAVLLELRIDNRNHTADFIPAVKRRLIERVKELVRVEHARRLDQHAVNPAHAKRDQLCFKASAVTIRVARARNAFDDAAVTLQLLKQHGIHIHRAVVILHNARLFALTQQIGSVFLDECRLARAEKSRYQIDPDHALNFSAITALPPSETTIIIFIPKASCVFFQLCIYYKLSQLIFQ